MKLLKTALSALCALCLLLSMLPAASADLEEVERFAGKSWLEIVEAFNDQLSVRPQNVAYGYCNTVTGEEHYYNGDTYMVSGSMYKVPLNMVVANELYNGDITWDTQFGGISYKKLQEGSIIHSDNDYAKILWLHVGNGVYRSYRRVIAPLMGEDADTVDPKFYENNFFTSRQMITCLKELYANSELYPGVIDCMKQAEPKNYFRKSENRFEIAHKYGFLEDNAGLHMNDCAIVWTDEPILIVCFTTAQFNAYDVLAQYCTLMCDYAQYTAAHREAAEGALDAALADLALPAFARQTEAALPAPETAADPTPEPVTEEAPAEEDAPRPIAPLAFAGLVLLGGGLFLLCAVGRRYSFRTKKRLLAFLLSLPMALSAIAVAAVDRSPAVRAGAGGSPEPMAPAITLFSHPDPQETVMAFFDALELQDYEKFYSLLDGYSSLGLEERPEDAAGRMVLGALKDSYSYRLEGESRVSGDSAEQDVYLRSLDLRAVEAALQESARAHLEQIASQRSYYELCDENGFYLPSVVQEACDAAIGDLLGRMPEFYADHELTLQLVYSGGWYVRGTDELVAAIQGTAS